MTARICIAVILLALVPGLQPARADRESKLEPPELGRYLRWGPFRVRPGFQIKNLGYDDNILLNDEERISDYTATLAPKVDGLVLFGDRAFLTFLEEAEYTAYADTSEQNFWNYRHEGRVTVPFGRFGVFGDLALRNLKERPIDREDLRPKRTETEWGGGVILLAGWRSEIEVGLLRRDISYSDRDAGSDIGDELDRVERTIVLNGRYRILGRTRITLDGTLGDIEFDDRTDRDAREITLLPGLEFGEGGRLTGRFRLGWSSIRPRRGDVDDFEGLVGDVALQYRFTFGTLMQTRYERRQDFAVFANKEFLRTTELGLRFIHYFNRILGAEIGGSTGRLSFEDRGPGPARRDDLLRYDAGVRLRLAENSLGRRIEYSLKIQRYERDSDIESLNNDRTTFGINAVVGF
jgi:hypothetical protein